MKFRTEIGAIKGSFRIEPDDKIVLIGSCFADNIGSRLEQDGFDAVHNPLGPLFNPESIARIITRPNKPYSEKDFTLYNGTLHCLDFANRYQDTDSGRLAETVNGDYLPLASAIEKANTIVITAGNTKVYRHNGITAGNCHKLPGYLFDEHSLSIEEITACLITAVKEIRRVNPKVKLILTLSPVRYPGDGLVQGSLAKASLRVGIDRVCREENCDYFPAYEILCDDLRDYRFYASDMRHPSDSAINYIYEKFGEAYFTEETIKIASERRKKYLREAHRPIVRDI